MKAISILVFLCAISGCAQLNTVLNHQQNKKLDELNEKIDKLNHQCLPQTPEIVGKQA